MMLRDCIRLCPDTVWSEGEHPRTFWRIVYHALHGVHFYAAPDSDSFTAWERHVIQARILWLDDEEGIPPKETTFSQADLTEYLDFISDNIDDWINELDLESPDSGFSWYPNMSKLEHQLVSLRHLGTHIGQLQERLYPLDVEPCWKGRG